MNTNSGLMYAPLQRATSFPVARTQTASARKSTTQAALRSVLMMASDGFAILLALFLSYEFHPARLLSTLVAVYTPLPGGTSVSVQALYLAFFVAAFLFLGWSNGLYSGLRLEGVFHEQRHIVQTGLTAGLLLFGAMYLTHNTGIARSLVVSMVLIGTAFVCILHVAWRYFLYNSYRQGIETKNVLIVGPTHIGEILRKQISQRIHLGREFKGFVAVSEDRRVSRTQREEIVGNVDQIRHLIGKHFIDEIIIADNFAMPILELVEMAHELDIDVLSVPGFYDEMATGAPVQHFGDFPVVNIHSRNGRTLDLFVKRICDILLSSFALLVLSPLFLIIAIAVKLDSPGSIFYVSDRIGKKNRVFRCLKFRTMVTDAERLKASLMEKNERQGILFKMKNDPRVTPLGRLLRKFSLDELPQLINVLRGEMSMVGPRPPIASEVEKYQLEHLRRLEVHPGLTGLWQVGARQDPSFERYFELDLAYVENWSFWLDLQILARTAHVVLRGTGS